MTEHYFMKTDRTRFVKEAKKQYAIFRCSRCDSEVAFDSNLSEADVNRAVQIRWPKFACVPKLLN